MVSIKTAQKIYKARNNKKTNSTKDFKGVLAPAHLPATIGFLGFVFSIGLFSLQLVAIPFAKTPQKMQIFYQDQMQTPQVKNLDKGYLSDQLNSRKEIDIDKRVLDIADKETVESSLDLDVNKSLITLTWESLKTQYQQFVRKIFNSTKAKPEVFVANPETPSLKNSDKQDLADSTVDANDSPYSLFVDMPDKIYKGESVNIKWDYTGEHIDKNSESHSNSLNNELDKNEAVKPVVNQEMTLGYSVVEYREINDDSYRLLNPNINSYPQYSGNVVWKVPDADVFGNYLLRITLYNGVPDSGVKIRSVSVPFEIVAGLCAVDSDCDSDQACNQGSCEAIVCPGVRECEKINIDNHKCNVTNVTEGTSCGDGVCLQGVCKSYIQGDIDGDGEISSNDLTKFTENYKTANGSYSAKYDINNDNKIDIFDYALLLKMVTPEL